MFSEAVNKSYCATTSLAISNSSNNYLGQPYNVQLNVAFISSKARCKTKHGLMGVVGTQVRPALRLTGTPPALRHTGMAGHRLLGH